MSRREIFSAAAPASGGILATALAHAPAMAATPYDKDNTVFSLIDAENDAWNRFHRACVNTDSIVLGREPTDEEMAEYEEANQAQGDALVRVMEAKASTSAGLIAMIDLFELREMESVGSPVDEMLAALFQSVRRGLIERTVYDLLENPARTP